MTYRDLLAIRRRLDRQISELVAELNDWSTPSKRYLEADRELRRLHELKEQLTEEMEDAA